MSDNLLWYLENIDVTNIFCPRKLKSSRDGHSYFYFKKGDFIYLPEDMSDRIYFLSEGRVKIGVCGEGGKEITKAILSRGEVFGELSLIGETSRRDFAFAMEDTTLCVLTVSEMKALLRDHSALSLFMMKIMGSRMLELEQRLESLVFKDSRTRIIEFLVDLVQKNGEQIGFEILVRKFMPHKEIANSTATSRQTVTTVLNELRAKNLITFDRKRLLVRDLDGMQAEISTQQTDK